MELRGASVLVTGATGFIGGRLVARLAAGEGARVRVLARDPANAAGLAALGAAVYAGDLTRPETLRAALEGCEVVFHAAVASLGSRTLLHETNVAGTRALAIAARAAGVRRFIHLSSIAVHGSHAPPVCREDAPLALAGSAYCRTKVGAEGAVRDEQARGLAAVILRLANVYGPGSIVWTLRPVQRILAGRMFLVGDGSGPANLLHVDNLLDALILAATAPGIDGETFLVSDGSAVAWREVFGRYAEMCGRTRPRAVPAIVARALAAAIELRARLRGVTPSLSTDEVRFFAARTTYDTSKLRRVLGFAPRVDLDAGLAQCERWLRERGVLR